MDNDTRSRRFESLLLPLAELAGDDPHTVLIDLLADAMHWCNLTGGDFHFLHAQACRHYVHELNGEQQDERRLG
jgi:hypothetical protein